MNKSSNGISFALTFLSGMIAAILILSAQSKWGGGWTGSDGNTYKIIRVD